MDNEVFISRIAININDINENISPILDASIYNYENNKGDQ